MSTRRIGLVAALALLAAACGAPEAVPEASGPSQGIVVHGDWTIEVRDPDGALAQRSEFENAFVGDEFLARLLANELDLFLGEVLLWPVLVPSSPELSACGAVVPNACDYRNVSAPLDIFSRQGDEGFELVVSAEWQADRDGDVVAVEMEAATDDAAFPFSERVLDAPELITTGQIIQLQVIYTFS